MAGRSKMPGRRARGGRAAYERHRRKSYNGRTELRVAGLRRLGDAQALLNVKDDTHAGGAVYLAGYAIECRLKAVALEVFGCWTLDELADQWDVTHDVVYTHGLEALAKRLPSWTRLRRNTAVFRAFSRVNAWRPSWRYGGGHWTIHEADGFVAQVREVLGWLDSNQ